MAVVVDSSPLIVFDAIGRLDIVTATFDQILIPDAVWSEIRSQGKTIASFGEELPARFRRQPPIAPESIPSELMGLGRGEREAIAIALADPDKSVVLDDKRARRTALSAGLIATGSAGVLLTAKRAGIISEVTPLLDRLIGAGLYVDRRLRRELIEAAGES